MIKQTIKQIIVIGILLCAASNASALIEYTYCSGGSYSHTYSFNGDGAAEYPNQGYISTSTGAFTTSTVCTYGAVGHVETYYYDTLGNNVNYSFSGYGSATCLACGGYSAGYMQVERSSGTIYQSSYNAASGNIDSSTADWASQSSTNYRVESKSYQSYTKCTSSRDSSNWCTLVISTTPLYSINGTTDCLTSVELSTGGNIIGTKYFNDTIKNYNFTDMLLEGFTYNLTFSNSYVYQFTCATSDIVYDYDACIHTTYRFEELCENLIPDSEGFYIEKIGDTVHAANNFYEPSGILDILQSPANNIYVSAEPFSGQIGWYLNPITNDTTYTLTNPNIAWGLKVVVQNDSDGALIDGATVRVNQSCYCTAGHSIRQKKTINGMVSYGDMSLQDASLWVYATGYKILDENTTGYNVFLSGRSNFSSKTWIVELAPNTGNNTSEWHETAHTTDIHFKDVGGNVTSKILDTDAYVRLYYQNNNSGEDSMTLKFQSSSTHTYFVDEQSWSIPHDESGYKEIATGYFTPWDYSYRATMYNSSIYGWNITIPLTVRNGTKETEQHYENLSTHLWFLNADDGKIDYRTDMDIGVHACSNNTTLMTVDVEVYKDNVLLCYKNLTASDFINADFPYYYVYEPQYSYVTGSNYSVRMYGFDRTLLETDYVDCITDAIIRKNRLTVQVKNRAGTPLTQSYIFLEGWGSLPTNGLSYNAYEGLEDGTYQYKASKSGYITSGWSIINMSGSDETVTYTLTSDTSGEALSVEKMTDDNIKAIFYPCIFFLLIIILLGGLRYVAS